MGQSRLWVYGALRALVVQRLAERPLAALPPPERPDDRPELMPEAKRPPERPDDRPELMPETERPPPCEGREEPTYDWDLPAEEPER
jgi:hypothetical protein